MSAMHENLYIHIADFHNVGSVQTILESYFQERAKHQNRHERDGIEFFS